MGLTKRRPPGGSGRNAAKVGHRYAEADADGDQPQRRPDFCPKDAIARCAECHALLNQDELLGDDPPAASGAGRHRPD